MTNNPTIDGVLVSRGSLEKFRRILSIYAPGDEDSPEDAAVAELHALLDAPAFERQDPISVLSREIRVLERLNESIDARQQRIDSLNGEPEVAALQSTIARLEAQLNNAIDLDFQRRERITQLESEKEFADATYQAARDRIAELESGLGEPVCYQARHSAEEPWFFTDKPGYWEWRPLFTAPPAPVAVVLPERRPEVDSEDPAILMAVASWNACLDATAALNAPKPTEWYDVAGDDEGVS